MFLDDSLMLSFSYTFFQVLLVEIPILSQCEIRCSRLVPDFLLFVRGLLYRRLLLPSRKKLLET